MKKKLIAVSALFGSALSCNQPSTESGQETGRVQLALTKAPSDLGCLKVSLSGARSQTKLIDTTPGVDTVYTFDRLAVGIVTISAEGYAAGCKALAADAVPGWVIDASTSVRVDPTDVAKVVLKLIRNGRLAVGVDFEVGPSPYVLPVGAGVVTKALLTVGDTVNNKPDGTPYRLVGLPDGLGAFDNADGTFSLLVNHEISSGGVVRAHGSAGAFVSKWQVRKSDMTVLKGEDLVQKVYQWDAMTSAYKPPGTTAFVRFCSADLAPLTAWYDATSATGYNGRIFANGEETSGGRAFAHLQDGSSWELPRMGKAGWENIVANPAPGLNTLVAGNDDSSPAAGSNLGGNVFFYQGQKTSSGTPIDKAGLTNGKLMAAKVTGFASEPSATGIPSGTAFTLVELGNVENQDLATFRAGVAASGATGFLRPEDGAWDPTNPNDYYFVTTNGFTAPSRLWRLHFSDLANPSAGGTLDMLLDGSEGQKMFDNLAIGKKGHIMLQEDVGNQDHNGKVWRYDMATKKLTLVAQHDPAKFVPGGAEFLTRDEESSGVIDASDLLGSGWWLLDVQAHYGIAGELVEGGQLLAVFDPATK